jgi:hypothetical protein
MKLTFEPNLPFQIDAPWRQLKMDFTDNYKIFVTLI